MDNDYILHIDYAYDKHQLHINKDQEEVNFNPKNIKRIYEIMLSTGRYSSIGNGSDGRSFHIFQSQFPDGQLCRSLHLTAGNVFSGKTITGLDVNLLESTMKRHGLEIAGKSFSYGI